MKNKFADLPPLGPVILILGISAIAYCVSKPLISVSLGFIVGIFGILSLRIPEQEKLEKWLSWLGVVLSLISIIWGLINIYVR